MTAASQQLPFPLFTYRITIDFHLLNFLRFPLFSILLPSFFLSKYLCFDRWTLSEFQLSSSLLACLRLPGSNQIKFELSCKQSLAGLIRMANKQTKRKRKGTFEKKDSSFSSDGKANGNLPSTTTTSSTMANDNEMMIISANITTTTTTTFTFKIKNQLDSKGKKAFREESRSQSTSCELELSKHFLKLFPWLIRSQRVFFVLFSL